MNGKRTGSNSDQFRPRTQSLSALSSCQNLRSGLLSHFSSENRDARSVPSLRWVKKTSVLSIVLLLISMSIFFLDL
ncbi:hypothetical protein QYF36_003175 [Acer negundo]|nr:hypothetical protein QYF36_003175 [Acer negundo]